MATHVELGLTKEEMADRNPATLRTIERLEFNKWVTVRMKDLHMKDIFRFADDHKYEYMAVTPPYVNDFYVWTIEADLIKK